MGLMNRIFSGGGNGSALSVGEGSSLGTNTGEHAIDKSKVLAQTATGVITPNAPGEFSSIRSAPVITAPRYFTAAEADAMKDLAKEKSEGARQAKRAYKAAGKIEEADKDVHKNHRKYEGVVADNELGKKRADAGLAKKLHGLRPGYARLGLGIDKAENNAATRISEIRAKLEAVRA